jgi:hypothetical protein
MRFTQAIHKFKKILREYEAADQFVLTEAGYEIFNGYKNADSSESNIEYAIEALISDVTEYDLSVISLRGLRQSFWMLCKPLTLYAPLFDERIFTHKLLGKPSPGLPPPYKRAAV